jgi:hypothetical protein
MPGNGGGTVILDPLVRAISSPRGLSPRSSASTVVASQAQATPAAPQSLAATGSNAFFDDDDDDADARRRSPTIRRRRKQRLVDARAVGRVGNDGESLSRHSTSQRRRCATSRSRTTRRWRSR